MIKTKYDDFFDEKFMKTIDDIYDYAKEKYNFNANSIIDLYAISYDATSGKTYFVAPVIPFKDIIKCYIANSIQKVFSNSISTVQYQKFIDEFYASTINLKDYKETAADECIKFINSMTTCTFVIDVSEDNNIEPILIAFDAARDNPLVSDSMARTINWKIDIYYGSIYYIEFSLFKNVVDIKKSIRCSAVFHSVFGIRHRDKYLPQSIRDGIILSIENDTNELINKQEAIVKKEIKKEEEPKMIAPDKEFYNEKKEDNNDKKFEFPFKKGDIIIDDGLYSNCYYHWSAYSSSAIEQALQIVKEYKKIKESNVKYDNLLLSYKLLHLMGETIDHNNIKINLNDKSKPVEFKWIEIPAGLSDVSYDMMKELYPNETFDKAIDRNVGLIGIHPKDVATTEKWEEGKLTLDINNECMWFDVYWNMVNVDTSISDEDFENEYCMTKEEYANLPELPKEPKSIYNYFNFCDEIIPFDDMEKLLEIINSHYKYKINDGFVSWIA